MPTRGVTTALDFRNVKGIAMFGGSVMYEAERSLSTCKTFVQDAADAANMPTLSSVPICCQLTYGELEY
jgi:hypothetical protein